MDATQVQTEIFNFIKTALPPHLALVDVIAETLELSNDSAYRRIRAEKQITLEELSKLSERFNFSVDRFLGHKPGSYLFTGKLADTHAHNFDHWLENSLAQFEFMAQWPYAHIYYMARDLPFACFFQNHELASFKFFFWQKSILQYSELKGAKYKLGVMTDYSREVADKIVAAYNKIHSSEIWGLDTINSILHQIEYYHEAGIFESKTDPIHLCDAFEELISHLESQAEEGLKFPFGKTPVKGNGNYFIYNNELNAGTNSVLVDMGDIKIAYLTVGLTSYISTRDKVLCEYQLSTALNMINKSEPLHTLNEKGRNAFFNTLRSKIEVTRRKLA